MADLSAYEFDPQADYGTSEARTGFELLPKGDYTVEITNADVKESRNKSSQYAEVEFTILEPTSFTGRRVWKRCVVWHETSADSVTRGKCDLQAICSACNIVKIRDTDELVGATLIINVYQKKRKDTGEMQNEVGDFKPIARSVPTVATRKPAAQPTTRQMPRPSLTGGPPSFPAPRQVKNTDAEGDDTPF